MSEWLDCVEVARRRIDLRDGTREAVERRLAEVGMDRTVASVRENYREFVRRTGAHDRYVEYFAACVMSHFGDHDRHEAPAWLLARLNRWRIAEAPVPPGTVRLEFAHGEPAQQPTTLQSVHDFIRMALGERDDPPPIYGPAGTIINRPEFSLGEPMMIVILPPGSRPSEGTLIRPERQNVPLSDFQDEMKSPTWKVASVPYGFEVSWPYEAPMLTATVDGLREARSRLASAGVVSTWLLVDRFVAFFRGGWFMLPLRTVKGLQQATTMQRLVGLPDAVPLAKLAMPVPLIVDGSGTVHMCWVDTPAPPGHLRYPFRFRHLGEVRALQPEVVADASLPSDEQAFVRKWRDLVAEVAVHRALRAGRGRPPKRTGVPGGLDYSKLVAMGYRRRLAEWGEHRSREQAELGVLDSVPRDPTPQDRQSMWEGAMREARQHVPADLRGPIEKGTKAAVEGDSPWRPSGG